MYISFVMSLLILNKRYLKNNTSTLTFPTEGLMISARNNGNFFTLISLEHYLQELPYSTSTFPQDCIKQKNKHNYIYNL